MTVRGLCAVVLAMASFCLGAGCDQAEPVGPPEVRLGRDECAECKMSIIEEKSAAAMRVKGPHGPELLLFDDPGCLLDTERSQDAGSPVLERWVRDHGSRKWVRAEGANYAFSERIHTPMGSGIAAFVERGDAEAASREAGGEVLTYAQLTARRAAWMEERYGKRVP